MMARLMLRRAASRVGQRVQGLEAGAGAIFKRCVGAKPAVDLIAGPEVGHPERRQRRVAERLGRGAGNEPARNPGRDRIGRYLELRRRRIDADPYVAAQIPAAELRVGWRQRRKRRGRRQIGGSRPSGESGGDPRQGERPEPGHDDAPFVRRQATPPPETREKLSCPS